MKRRKFISLIGGAAAIWPFAAYTQQHGMKVARIGLLMPVSTAAASKNVAALRNGLRELGYIDGQTLSIEERYSEGHDNVLPHLAADLVELNVDIIVTWGTPATNAARQATTTKPIVMAAVADPIGTGFATNLARPNQNITGLSSISLDIDAKRLERLKDLVPTAKRVGALWNPANPVSTLILNQTKAAATTLGLELVPAGVSETDNFAAALATLAEAHLDALTVQTEVALLNNKIRILEFAAEQKLPATYGYRDFVDAGGLMFYGPSWPDLFRRAATYIDKILKDAKPTDLPIEQPTKFELIINVKTAKTLGLTVPQTLLAAADEVVE